MPGRRFELRTRGFSVRVNLSNTQLHIYALIKLYTDIVVRRDSKGGDRKLSKYRSAK